MPLVEKYAPLQRADVYKRFYGHLSNKIRETNTGLLHRQQAGICVNQKNRCVLFFREISVHCNLKLIVRERSLYIRNHFIV